VVVPLFPPLLFSSARLRLHLAPPPQQQQQQGHLSLRRRRRFASA